jgi:hypothetical protein
VVAASDHNNDTLLHSFFHKETVHIPLPILPFDFCAARNLLNQIVIPDPRTTCVVYT